MPHLTYTLKSCHYRLDLPAGRAGLPGWTYWIFRKRIEARPEKLTY